ncbi:Protein CBG22621 [Caenorhabditis briggsae]|uniref:Protein CBG22621 n=1 Tax=Caenorhabditis briggsae TaxID=6238 RepID=A8Y2P8_CAEBR|nr:Protein CBG22621 [Caenorhabditis briggsae]CAP39173.2 Protein CBG22621 [Caenorhabditis briggsae]
MSLYYQDILHTYEIPNHFSLKFFVASFSFILLLLQFCCFSILLVMVFPFYMKVYRENRKKEQSIYYIFLNILIYASAILHIPIVLKIRNNSHLPSVIKNQPQNYVLYQTIFMPCFKTPQIYAVSFVYWYHMSLDFYILLCLIFDVLSTPLLIQISYLCCNRRNVKSLRANLSFGVKIKSIFTTDNSKIGPMTVSN